MAFSSSWYSRALSLLILAAACSGCDPPVGPNSPVVGGACSHPDDCAVGSICLQDGDFPGGMCSILCADARECPQGSVCIDKKGGICLQNCASHADCRPDYKCDDKDLFDIEAKALVCVKD